MNEKVIQTFSLFLIGLFGIFIIWLYWAEPKNLEEVSAKAKTTIETVGTRTQVAIGTYEIDREKFARGLEAFRQERYPVARDLFERADPEDRDARTQYYIAYTFYRQGWGRVANDDELFQQGLEQIDRVIALDPDFRADDTDLGIKTPIELKNEFQEGLRTTWSDFNPLRLTRERK